MLTRGFFFDTPSVVTEFGAASLGALKSILYPFVSNISQPAVVLVVVVALLSILLDL